MRGDGGRSWSAVAVLSLVLSLLAAAPASAAAPCSRGHVALTFDDGPRAGTGPVLDRLASYQAPATFFVVGQNVAASPRLVARAAKEGHVVANHTYRHERLVNLGDSGIRRTLSRTDQAIRAAGARPAPLARPPYGATNARVRRVMNDAGYVQMLWSVDPQDWRPGRSSSTIASLVLSGLAPNAVILLHDGTGNWRATHGALPRIITGARDRGYCFGLLDDRGRVVPPAPPEVTVADASVSEGGDGDRNYALFDVRLSRVMPQPVSLEFTTIDGTARAGVDYVAKSGPLVFSAGEIRKQIKIAAIGNHIDQPDRSFRVQLRNVRGATLTRAEAVGTIIDDDPPSRLSVRDLVVDEGAEGELTPVPFEVRLNRPSGKPVTVRYRTADATAVAGTDYEAVTGQLTFEPGDQTQTVTVWVFGNNRDESHRRFTLELHDAVNATFARASASGVIRDDDTDHALVGAIRRTASRVNPTTSATSSATANGTTQAPSASSSDNVDAGG